MTKLIEIDKYPVKDTLLSLLKDKTTGENITFATDAYSDFGFFEQSYITKDVISTIDLQPRVTKSLEEQTERTRKKAEVFTPIWICDLMINECYNDFFGADKNNKITFSNEDDLKSFVSLKFLEITCGEAPYLVSRYDATTGKKIAINKRIGILDRKLRVINENAQTEEEWLEYAFIAFRSVYGYEFQGDNLLIARINLLITFCDYLYDKWNRKATKLELKKIANIICWNIWQMDGLSDSVPFAQEHKQTQISFFGAVDEEITNSDILCKIKDWSKNRSFVFNELQENRSNKMKFDYVIGNPPYQGENHQQLYPDFYLSALEIGDCVEMIFPTGWQEPKSANNLKRMNTPEIKEDRQIVFINNLQNAFPEVAGAEWTNIIMWRGGR